MLRFLSAGESHGNKIMGILEGIPANLELNIDIINKELARRQKGYGRSSRMTIEKDQIEIIAGLNGNLTTGAPIGFLIDNKGTNIKKEEIFTPRPGHGDLAGLLKYNQPGGRNVLERASARETAIRVAVGGICKEYLKQLNIFVFSHVTKIAGIRSRFDYYSTLDLDYNISENSILSVMDQEAEKQMIDAIDKATNEGYSLGGEIQLVVKGAPVGLGSHVQWDRKLDGQIGQAVLSVQGIKSIAIGLGHEFSNSQGFNSFDEIFYDYTKGYFRKTNRAGGIEGGISNGEDIVLKATMKPIPTQRTPLRSVDINTKKEAKAFHERADICAVPAAAVVVEAMVAYTIAKEIIEKFGGDSMEELKNNYSNYIEEIIMKR